LQCTVTHPLTLHFADSSKSSPTRPSAIAPSTSQFAVAIETSP
jgi:hypothetical protein